LGKHRGACGSQRLRLGRWRRLSHVLVLLEEFNVTYQLLDRVPRGRDEGELPYPQAWHHRRDEYGAGGM